jgi:hypothetical protein
MAQLYDIINAERKKGNKKMKNKKIYFDMDGTIADFYATEDWLERLENEDTYPYEIAKPLMKMNVLARRLNALQKIGYKIGIISWTAKNSSYLYHTKVESAKRKWLKKHLASVKFDEIKIVRYDTPKHEIGNGILFDDNTEIREEWDKAKNTNLAFDVDNILKILGYLV